MILCCDTETTGLKPDKHHLLELALVVAKDDLTVVGQFSAIFPNAVKTQDLFQESDANVQKMHTDSGLWLELWQDEQKPLEQRKTFTGLMQEVLTFLAPFGLGPNAKVPIFGRNPGFDLGFLQTHAPLIADCFSHRKIDTTTFQYRVESRYGKECVFKLPDGQRHRALDDALAAIEEQKYYETNFMR